ncbi:MAG: hypothetical protein HY245_10530 [Rhizobiales bacterium]|nr:hypothetical protein [Hyphomicrobiales bacterium]MBI3673833.1 hypothetical protein [Hyphomicrobiales bacterium]
MIKMIFGKKNPTRRLRELEEKHELSQAVVNLHFRVERMLATVPAKTQPRESSAKAA